LIRYSEGTLAGVPAVTDVGFAATFNENTGNAVVDDRMLHNNGMTLG